MDDLSIQEIKAISEVLVSIEITEEVKTMLDQLEAGEIGVEQVIGALEVSSFRRSKEVRN